MGHRFRSVGGPKSGAERKLKRFHVAAAVVEGTSGLLLAKQNAGGNARKDRRSVEEERLPSGVGSLPEERVPGSSAFQPTVSNSGCWARRDPPAGMREGGNG